MHPTESIPLSFAVAASSAFPPLFPPLILPRKMLGATMMELPYDQEYLTDGGVFDNVGFEQFLRLQNRDKLKLHYLIISDAGASFDWTTKKRLWWIVPRTIRSTDILMNRVCEATLSRIQQYGICGARTVQLRISEKVSTGDFESLPEAVQARIGRSILSPDIQVRIGRVRTDLDRFSDDEAALIHLHGYEVACAELSKLSKKEEENSKKEEESPLSKYVAKLAEPNAKFPRWDRSTISAVTLLDKSKRRSYGVFSFRDWISYVMVFIFAVCIAVIALALLLLR